MPAKITLSENELNSLAKFVNGGKTYAFLTDEFDLTYKVLKRIVEENNLKDQMDKNIEKQRKRIPAEIQKNKAKKRYESVDEKYGDEIRDGIDNGLMLLKDVANLVGRSTSFAKSYLEYIGYDQKRRKNSKKVKAKQAIINGKHGLTGKDNPQYGGFSEEVLSWYSDKLNRGWYKWKIYRKLYAEFGYSEKKFNELIGRFEKKPRNYSFEGKNNPMYGRSPSKDAGKGIYGHYKKRSGDLIHFRSSLELKVFYDLDCKSIHYKKCNLRIPYTFENEDRTYLPDLVINNKVYEIKPEPLIEKDINQSKNNALKYHCKKSNHHEYGGFITSTDNDLSKDKFYSLLKEKRIKMDESQIKRITKYLD